MAAVRQDAHVAAVRSLLAEHLPRVEVRSVVRLGEGGDNVVLEVNGDLLLRWSKEADPGLRATAVRRDADVLALVAGWSTLPVPEPIVVDVEVGVLAYPKLPGEPLLWLAELDPTQVAATLGEFLSRLHEVQLDAVAGFVPHDVEPLPAWRDEAAQHYGEVAAHLTAPARRTVEAFLGTPLPAEPEALVLCHDDLGAEHVLVAPADGRVTGVIDWSDAAIADPVVDLALLLRDLGQEAFERVVNHYDRRVGEADRARARFYARCALLEDVAYGLRTGDGRYSDAGLAHLDRTFAD